MPGLDFMSEQPMSGLFGGADNEPHSKSRTLVYILVALIVGFIVGLILIFVIYMMFSGSSSFTGRRRVIGGTTQPQAPRYEQEHQSSDDYEGNLPYLYDPTTPKLRDLIDSRGMDNYYNPDSADFVGKNRYQEKDNRPIDFLKGSQIAAVTPDNYDYLASANLYGN